MAQARVEAVLVDTAVPGLGNQRLGRQAAFGEMAVDKGGQFTGAGVSGVRGHGRFPYCRCLGPLRMAD
ncbi:hypothetical protein D3C78_1868850 [compost metagenome]